MNKRNPPLVSLWLTWLRSFILMEDVILQQSSNTIGFQPQFSLVPMTFLLGYLFPRLLFWALRVSCWSIFPIVDLCLIFVIGVRLKALETWVRNDLRPLYIWNSSEAFGFRMGENNRKGFILQIQMNILVFIWIVYLLSKSIVEKDKIRNHTNYEFCFYVNSSLDIH